MQLPAAYPSRSGKLAQRLRDSLDEYRQRRHRMQRSCLVVRAEFETGFQSVQAIFIPD
ncbi:MAG: hypothetical protein QOG58_647 [Caballeronia sp.]|jgi:hypothetical protein|nr:hypothetical protein [Caballeronia sp.]